MTTHVSENPVCVSLLICDDVYRDARTGKQVIVGTFNHVRCPSLPHQHQRLWVVFTITDARGEINLSLKIEHEESEEELVKVQGPYHADDPLAIHDVNVELVGVEFHQEGKHWVKLESNGAILAQRPFMVRCAGAEPGPTEDSS